MGDYKKKDQTSYKEVQLTLFVIFLLNIAVAVLKMVVGKMIGSASLTADGYHSLSDGMSNIVGMIGVRFASLPDDDEHPYGHNKIESLAGLAIGIMLLIVALKTVLTAYEKFMNPTAPDVTLLSIVALIGTLIVNILITKYESKKGKELNSTILVSDASHTKSDIFISIGVLLTLIGIKMGLPAIIDPIVTFIVSLFIFHASWEVIYENWSILIDTSNVDSEIIRNCVMEFEHVKDVHKIRSRGTNNRIYIDMHILVDGNMTVEESHEMQHQIELKIKELVNNQAHVIMHVEPYIEDRVK